MESTQKQRAAIKKTISETVGQTGQTAFVYSLQIEGARHQPDLFAMPVDTSEWQPLGVIDPASPDFGKTYFMPGYHAPGDTANHPLR